MPARSVDGLNRTEQAPSRESRRADVVVLGGTPGGIAAAVAAGRLGQSVLLIEYHRHIGGMAASGLGKSDIEHRSLVGGLFREFTERVLATYVERYGPASNNVHLCDHGYYYEPSVAEAVFEAMVRRTARHRRAPRRTPGVGGAFGSRGDRDRNR